MANESENGSGLAIHGSELFLFPCIYCQRPPQFLEHIPFVRMASWYFMTLGLLYELVGSHLQHNRQRLHGIKKIASARMVSLECNAAIKNDLL